MKKMVILVSGFVLISVVIVALRLAAPEAIAEKEGGLSPLTALPLNEGRNTGILAPGESRWYELAPSVESGFQRQVDLTLFFTPDNGSRTHHVNFQVFPARQITSWQGGVGQMPNLGAGGIVSRDGNPVTGELLWSGWMENSETYIVQVFNGADVTIDYWLFTDNVIAAELGPTTDQPPTAEVDAKVNQDIAPIPVPAEETAVEMGADHLLPLASELQNDQAAVEPEIWDVPVGTPTRLVIPAISLDSGIVPVGQTPVVINGVAYGQWNTADNRVGWHDRSAKLGSAGNTVLNGHSDVNAAVFRSLRFVEIGDEITVLSGDQDYHYRVTHKFLVQERDVPLEERIKNAVWVAPTQDDRLTLITCANLGATHRLILIAQP